jgi:hypothetical protein
MSHDVKKLKYFFGYLGLHKSLSTLKLCLLKMSSATIAYDLRKLSDAQIDAGKRITHAFETSQGIRWVILQAQMQSGKTETYLFDACERLRLRLVENVVIFSGNAEIDLKEQLKKEVMGLGDAKFYGKYNKYLRTIYLKDGRDIDEALDIIEDILVKVKTHIHVVWGPELKNYSGPTSNTLFIWEESHHAQSVNNCPAKFLQTVGISANGDSGILSEKNNFVVSISATPFSELSDRHHLNQCKMVVIMTPGVNYVSVKHIRDSGRLKAYSNMQEGLQRALATPHASPMYAIVRISIKNEDIVKSIISRCGWNYVVFDSLAKGEEKIVGDNAWNNMATKPDRDTVILIRGKCRMGKNLQKSHVLFVFETAKNSNTDTVLQGLLGRVCGYSDGSDRIQVWLNSKIINSGEIDRYIDMTDGIQVIPRKAMNLAKETIRSHEPIIPIKIMRDTMISSTNDRPRIINDVIDALLVSRHRISNKNSDAEFEQLLEKVQDALTCRQNFKCHYLSDKKKTYKGKAQEIVKGFTSGTRTYLGAGCGINSEATEINVWIPKDVDIMERDAIYITAHVKNPNANDSQIPHTTRREIFAYGLEDGTEAMGNGSFSIDLGVETAHSVEAMKDDIDFIIQVSFKRPNSNKKIVSNWDEKTKEYKGIVVNKAVLAAISPNGSIWKEMKEKYGVELSLVKSRGAIPKLIKDAGLTKLAAISW